MATRKKRKVEQVLEKVSKEKQIKQLLLDQASLFKLEGIDELLQGDVKLDQIDFDSLRQEIKVAFENLGEDYELTVGTDLSCFGLAEAYEAFKDDADVCVKCDKKELCVIEIANRSLTNQDKAETAAIEEIEETKGIEEVIKVKEEFEGVLVDEKGVNEDLVEVSIEEESEEKEEVKTEVDIKEVKQVKEIKPKKSGNLGGLVNPYRETSIVGVAFDLLAEKIQSLDSLVLGLQVKFPQKDEVAIRRALHFMFDHGKMFFAIEQDVDGNLSLFETVIKGRS